VGAFFLKLVKLKLYDTHFTQLFFRLALLLPLGATAAALRKKRNTVGNIQ
jgi:hypothetical protein